MIEIKCVIFDFGGVISKPQTRDYLEKMIEISGLEEAEFVREYRNKRHDYDRGTVCAEEYWEKVLENSLVNNDAAAIRKLIEYDVAAWTSINGATKAYIDHLLQKGVNIAIISNINFETVRHLEKHQSWITELPITIFSCELKYIKPEREIYEACLRKVCLEPHECLFIDDSDQNVHAARSLGLNAILFENSEKMRQDIDANYRFSVEAKMDLAR